MELHDDGTVIVAATRDAAYPGGSATGDGREIAVCDLEQGGVDLLRALAELQHQRGDRTDYAMRIGVSNRTEIFRHLDPSFGFKPFDETDRIRDFRAVDGPVIGSQNERALMDSVFDVIADAVNQTGAELWSDPGAFAPR